MKKLEWNFRGIWDAAFEKPEEEPKARDYVYASEIGYPFLDVYLKMKGVPYSNHPTPAARRKMEAGKLLEMVANAILARAGILRFVQEKIDYQLSPDLLSVHGKCDFITNPQLDPEMGAKYAGLIESMVSFLGMPEIYLKMANNMQEQIKEILAGSPNSQLEEYVIECKSTSAFVFDMIEAQNAPTPTHKLQNFHYIKGKNLDKGKVLYISREDVRLKEFFIHNNADTEAIYREWVEKITWYYKNNEEPAPEPLITFNPETMKFYKNTVGVEWSRYLTAKYGYNTPEDFRNDIGTKVTSMNRVFARCVSAAKMTAKNMEVIEAARKYFPDWDDMVDKAKLRGIVLEEETATGEI